MTLAALIESEPDASRPPAQEEEDAADRPPKTPRRKTTEPPPDGTIKVVYVADIDLMIPAFLRIRARRTNRRKSSGSSRTSRSC